MHRPVLLLLALLLCAGPVLAQDNPVHNLKPTGDLEPLVAAIESARLYPVFVLPLGPGYYDFELKASVTNWVGSTVSTSMVYWVASAIDNQPTLPIWDPSPTVFFTASSFSDPRKWYRYNPALIGLNSIYGVVGAGSTLSALVVVPSKISGSSAWMFKGNVNLVWSYARITPVGLERDPNGQPIWHPAVPVEWRSAPMAPAQ